jgi:hypothetical protein
VVSLFVVVAATEKSTAGFSKVVTKTSVEIDGESYGAFEPITNLDERSAAVPTGQSFRIVLQRDFVTDPSLYLWANSFVQLHVNAKDIALISQNAEGQVLARHTLRLSQPVSWDVEAGRPGTGGFHEKVEFAVQHIQKQ